MFVPFKEVVEFCENNSYSLVGVGFLPLRKVKKTSTVAAWSEFYGFIWRGDREVRLPNTLFSCLLVCLFFELLWCSKYL